MLPGTVTGTGTGTGTGSSIYDYMIYPNWKANGLRLFTPFSVPKKKEILRLRQNQWHN
jgi:hypothetical protein